MRLDISKPKRRELVLALPDGGSCTLILRRVVFNSLDAFEAKAKEITDSLKAGKITSTEYYIQILEHRCEDFDRSILGGCDEFDLVEIMNKINDLRMGKVDEDELTEKKT